MTKEELRRKYETQFRYYAKMGFKLFPVGNKTKVPCFKGNLKRATDDVEELMQWWGIHMRCNWGLSLATSGLVAVDVDTRNGGMEWFLDYSESCGWPTTLKQISGTEGFHFIFRAKRGVRYHNKIRAGVDIKHNGYILIFPSRSSNGERYEWAKPIHKISHYDSNVARLIERGGI